jgi:hypothetical protein
VLASLHHLALAQHQYLVWRTREHANAR